MKITKRQLRRIIKEEKAKILAENRVRKAVRKSLREAVRIAGDYPEEFGGGPGREGYDWVRTGNIEVGDYVEVVSVNGDVVRGITLKHGDSTKGGPIFITYTKSWDGRQKADAQIHMMTEPDAKGSGGGDEYVDFKLKAGTSKIKRAKPGYQQMKMDL
jgi:hypothetical protein